MGETVFIGNKDISRYISACFYALGKSENLKIISRGSNIKKSIDILAILTRDYLENPKYSIVVGSEPFENRNVSTLEITLSGLRKSKEIIEKNNKEK